PHRVLRAPAGLRAPATVQHLCPTTPKTTVHSRPLHRIPAVRRAGTAIATTTRRVPTAGTAAPPHPARAGTALAPLRRGVPPTAARAARVPRSVADPAPPSGRVPAPRSAAPAVPLLDRRRVTRGTARRPPARAGTAPCPVRSRRPTASPSPA